MMITGKTLFAFVDSKDPFAPSLVAGEEQAGPILSLMASRPFDFLFLFYTPNTQTNAHETSREVGLRYPDCQVVLQELPDSSPEQPLLLIQQLSRRVHHAMRSSRDSENLVCMSSGTTEMRAALFFLVAAGVLSASLLHVGSPAERLFDPGDVKEVSLVAPEGRSQPEQPPDIETQMELLEAEVPHASSDRPPELEAALREIRIYIHSEVMRHAAETIAKVADSTLPILILGENGTGKELFARLVRRLSGRRDKAFVPVSCAGLPKDLMESMLFGHAKGAFTGAINEHRGIFEQADKGTLFLDEIGELSNGAQAALLRVLQEGEIQRVGSPQVRKVDVRIIAATNQNLQERMGDGRFRLDLYHRLSGLEVRLPPLRERREEILPLAMMFLDRHNQESKCQKRLAKSSISYLTQHSWPGNVREIYNVIWRARMLAEDDVIEPKHLVFGTVPSGQSYLDLLPAPAPGFDLNEFLGTVRAHQIRKALSICNDNQSRAAKLLGMSRQAVSEFLSKPNGDDKDA